jgi:hypothetical protein
MDHAPTAYEVALFAAAANIKEHADAGADASTSAQWLMQSICHRREQLLARQAEIEHDSMSS